MRHGIRQNETLPFAQASMTSPLQYGWPGTAIKPGAAGSTNSVALQLKWGGVGYRPSTRSLSPITHALLTSLPGRRAETVAISSTGGKTRTINLTMYANGQDPVFATQPSHKCTRLHADE